MLLNIVNNTSEYLTELLNMNYLSLFKLYFNDCEPLKKMNLKGKDFILSNKTKSFYYLVKKIILMKSTKIHLLSPQKMLILVREMI